MVGAAFGSINDLLASSNVETEIMTETSATWFSSLINSISRKSNVDFVTTTSGFSFRMNENYFEWLSPDKGNWTRAV